MRHRLTLLLGIALAVVLLGGEACKQRGSEDDGSALITLYVLPNAGGGYRGGVFPAAAHSGWQVPYPGLLCYRANHLIVVSNVRVNFDGTLVSFNISSLSASPFNTLWFKLFLSRGATLQSRPQVVNGRGENIFVVGPLAAYGKVTMTLRVTPPAQGGYILYFDFLDVRDRIAYSSDGRSGGVAGHSEIFTINPDGSGPFQVTRDSPGLNQNPAWSPQGEWIAFDRETPADCGGNTVMSSQVFIVHPDGSNLTQVSQGMFSASSPAFNPNGQLLAFQCRPACDAISTAVNACLYDLGKDAQRPLFSGTGFDQDQVLLPRFSPDGQYLVMRADEAGTGASQWVYAPMDPLTGDSLGSPAAFLNGDRQRVLPDGFTYRLEARDFSWGPDSSHAVVEGDYLRWDAGAGDWIADFTGLAVFDFAALLAGPLPEVPDITRVVDAGDGAAGAPDFDRSGALLWFDSPALARSDLEYAALEAYAPVSYPRRSVTLADGFLNRSPAPRSPALPAFFPPPPLGQSDQIPIIITVTPDPDGGYEGLVTDSTHGGERYPYPGVDCYLENYQIKIRDVVVSDDGNTVSFKIESNSSTPFEMLWAQVWTNPGATLDTRPAVVNGDSANIFVIGPLDPAGQVSLSLKVTPAGTGGYYLYFNFVEVLERMAFASDRADPGGREEIFTIGMDGSSIFEVTGDSPNVNANPTWSPGREWIAFSRLVLLTCGSTTEVEPQIFAVHPDGSNLRWISQGTNMASDPTFGPSGRLLAYDCRPGCPGPTAQSICLYDFQTDTQKVLFTGVAYEGGHIIIPQWSPDGQYMIMRSNAAADGALLWNYALMDPVTGDSLSTPAVFIRGTKGRLIDGYYYRITPVTFAWAPDSKHVAVNANLLRYNPGPPSSWPIVYTGLLTFDFDAFIHSAPSLPDVPDLTKVVDDTAGEPNSPCFDKAGTRLYYDRYHNYAWTDLQYTPLTNYAPVVYNQRINFLADHYNNRSPALVHAVMPAFFPSEP